LLLALTLAATAALPTPADAQAPDGATNLHADDAIKYRVEVDAPEDVAATVRNAVDLIRWQDFADMTEDLFDRLARDAVPQAREAASTLGFFSAVVEVTVDRATQPVSVRLSVKVGEPTRISTVAIDVSGPANDTPEGEAAITRMRDTWLLPAGQPFRQERWTAAKNLAVSTLAASPYAAARLTASEALIDPEARTGALTVAIASGPAFHVGDIEVGGLVRYTREMVVNFSPIHDGDLYSQQPLDEFVRRLLASGYFASVQASIDANPENADHATVTVTVIEAPPKRLEFGAGYSTDTQYRVSAAYNDMNVNGHGLQMYTSARIETKVQEANIRFVRPPTSGGWIDSFGAGIEYTDIENLVTHTASIKARRRAIEERRTPAFGIGYYWDAQTPSGWPKELSHALYIDAEYTWRNVDDLLDPTRGWMANVQAGIGPPGVSSEKFGRVIGKAIGWWPLSESNQLTVRADVGAVIADSRNGIPSPFLFRTGGDTTVRGYAFDSLGVAQGDAVVGGRYYAVGSVEVEHWVTQTLGLAAFVDAGNATDTPSHFKPALGYGVGGRLRTPIGPFRLDVAYGQDVHNVRIHFSVGLSF
jgi:translocation and assembly module TamA